MCLLCPQDPRPCDTCEKLHSAGDYNTPTGLTCDGCVQYGRVKDVCGGQVRVCGCVGVWVCGYVRELGCPPPLRQPTPRACRVVLGSLSLCCRAQGRGGGTALLQRLYEDQGGEMRSPPRPGVPADIITEPRCAVCNQRMCATSGAWGTCGARVGWGTCCVGEWSRPSPPPPHTHTLSLLRVPMPQAARTRYQLTT